MTTPARAPRKPTPQRLRNQALHHLGRFAASRAHLRSLLLRRALKAGRPHGMGEDVLAPMVDAVVADLVGLGLLDDRAYALTRARGLAGRGRSPRMIRLKLAQQGVAGDLIAASLDRLAEERGGDPVLASAVVLARKRRLGPFGPSALRDGRREKDLAAFARAGFPYAVARRVLDAETPEELEESGA